MITHHRLGGDVDGEDFGQQGQAFDQPGFAVIEVLAGLLIVAAQEGPPHATGDAVVVGRVGQRDELGAGPDHQLPASHGFLQAGIVKILQKARLGR